jgi:hypothetical protein
VAVFYYDLKVGHPDCLASDPPHMRDSLPWRLKEDSYAWQQEWRFIWLPDTELTGELPPIELAIGSVSDTRGLGEPLAVLLVPNPDANLPCRHVCPPLSKYCILGIFEETGNTVLVTNR